MKLTLHLAILAVAAQGLDIAVEDAFSVEDTSSVLLMESISEGALPVEGEESSSVRWKEKNDMLFDRVLKAPKPTKSPTRKSLKKPTTTPTKQPTKQPTKRPTEQPTKKPTQSPSSAPSASPAPSPAPSTSPSASPAPSSGPTNPCFPGDAIVTVEGKGQVRMKDVKIGDRVLGMGGKFHSIYAFGHRAFDPPTEYIRLYTNATSEPLEISSRHFVFLFDQQVIPAVPSFLKVGDVLLGADSAQAALEIIKIDTVMKKGFYAPLTADGTIAVNGVVASSFTFSPPHSLDDPHDYVYMWRKHKIVSINAFHQIRYSPLRLLSLGISPWFGALADKEGRNFLSCAYKQAGTWMRSSTHGAGIVALGTMLFYSLCGFAFFCYFIECMSDQSWVQLSLLWSFLHPWWHSRSSARPIRLRAVL